MRSGKKLPIQYSAQKAGKVILFAVDEGILQLSNYQTPDPLNHYFAKEELAVRTAQMADLILPKFRAESVRSATGGDGCRKLLAMHLNPFKKKADKAVVFWSGMVEVGPDVKNLDFSIPEDFCGNLRVMAVAVGSDAVGSASCSTLVQKDFILHAHAPTFMAPDDMAGVSVSVTNTQATGGLVQVQLFASKELEIVGESMHILPIPPGEKRTLTFQVKAQEHCGAAELTFVVAQGEKSSQSCAHISVRPAVAYQTHLSSGYADFSKTVDHRHQFYPEFRTLQAVASTSPMILAQSAPGHYLGSLP